jgi:cell wall-associated protease
MNMIKILSVLALMAGSAQATKIAVIDSGTDLSHTDLKNKKWFNPKDIDDAVDNDDNGLIDDINGWNFAENNNKLYDKTLVGTFSPDVYKFFEVQTRMMKGEATDADREWMTNARNNRELISQLQVFGNFVHGTHVAGIAAKGADQAEVMVLKMIPTKPGINPKRTRQFAEAVNANAQQITEVDSKIDSVIKMALKGLATQQSKLLGTIGQYVGKGKARVANCSFGTSTHAVKTMIMPPLLKLALRRAPTDEELDHYSAYFVNQAVDASKAMPNGAKDTLFVIAAGNDGMNNDVYPTSPANLRMPNTITVAATLGYQKIASFSNYGEKMVDVAAPGVGIESAIPGQQYLTVSGTSQASPFVANVAGMLIDANPNLSNSDLKKILMQTADLKDFLKGKVVSSGIVNTDRAIMAAKLALTMQLDQALESARVQINDVQGQQFMGVKNEENTFVLPMPMLF